MLVPGRDAARRARCRTAIRGTAVQAVGARPERRAEHCARSPRGAGRETEQSPSAVVDGARRRPHRARRAYGSHLVQDPTASALAPVAAQAVRVDLGDAMRRAARSRRSASRRRCECDVAAWPSARASAVDDGRRRAVMRPETVRRYAAEAGFAEFEVLPIANRLLALLQAAALVRSATLRRRGRRDESRSRSRSASSSARATSGACASRA